jgi:hypothetical protein
MVARARTGHHVWVILAASSLLWSMFLVAAPEPAAPVPDAAYTRRVNWIARGVGVGIRQGLWGAGFGQSLHVDVPFGRRVGQFAGLRVHGMVVHPTSLVDYDRYDPVVFGALELFGRSPVMAGLVRLYGGGGVFAGGRPRPTAQGRAWGIAGGGHLGIEFFAWPRSSFSVEIGGQGPVHALDLDAGASVLGGINFYLGRDPDRARR